MRTKSPRNRLGRGSPDRRWQSDEHDLTVLRYVERNPLRANMAQRSQDRERSSLKPTTRSRPNGADQCNLEMQKVPQASASGLFTIP